MSVFHNGTALPMVGVMTCCTVFAIIIYFIGQGSAASYREAELTGSVPNL